jgi:GNAT superfamily N-acetyltransferase
MSFSIRKALPADALGIHEAHMKSIQVVCARDHTAEEVAGWGGRPYDEALRLRCIRDHFVWVIVRTPLRPEDGREIFGYADFEIKADAITGEKFGYLHALYFMNEVTGLGFGKKLMEEMFKIARDPALPLKKIGLNATLTAHDFYRKYGFCDTGPMQTYEINGAGVRCFPMEWLLSE